MISRFPKLIFLFLVAAFCALSVNAQTDAYGRPIREEPMPKGIRETLKKNQIEQEKKEYAEMLKRGEEAAQISEELSKSFEQNQNLSAEDVKKLARLEKLVKKIRDDLGGEDDDEANADKPSSLMNALKSVQENASTLLSALKKTTRLSISAVAIETSNAVLKLVKFIRFYRN